MTRKISRLASLLLIVLMLVELSFTFDSHANDYKGKPTKLTVIVLPYLSFVPLFIAEAEGFFSEQGIENEYVKFTKGVDAIAALVKGDIDVWAGAVSIGLLTAIRKTNIRMVAGKGAISSDCSYYSLLTRRALLDSGDLAAADAWKTRRVVLRNRGNVEQYLLFKTFRQLGRDLRDTQRIRIPITLTGKAFKDRAIDIVAIAEPWITLIQQGDSEILSWIEAQEIIPNYQLAAIAYGDRLLKDDPDLGKRFMVAYLKAVRQYNQGKTPRNLHISAESTRLDKAILEKACWPAIQNNGMIHSDTLIDYQQWAIDEGLFDPPIMTAGDFFTPDFVIHADKVLEASGR